ncbi:MAG: hypothetical protein ACFUZC_14095 [Chthoniobacteraceae bacterium]
MNPRKNTCTIPQNTQKPFAIEHIDHGIFSELRITNVGSETVIAGLTINDEFHPAVEVGGKEWFRPLDLPRKLPIGASLAVMLRGPSGYVRPEDCYGGYPKKVEVLLSCGETVTFGEREMIRRKA